MDRPASPPRPISTAQEVDGVLVVDKPEGLASFAVVSILRRDLGVGKVGHCGTLDPFATGVLVLCLNQATRIAELLATQDKRYEFRVRFGAETDTLDKTGRVVSTYAGPPVPRGRVEEALEGFAGGYLQEAPRFSAVHVRGKRLYHYARKGIFVEPPKREVKIHELALRDFSWPEALLEVFCSKGTYVRQLASDIGRVLGCGAVVAQLRRLASGPFGTEDCIRIEELKKGARDGSWQRAVLPMNRVLVQLESLVIREEEVLRALSCGHLDPSWEARMKTRVAQSAGPVRLLTGTGRLAALWWPAHGAAGRSRLQVFRFEV